MSASTQPDTPLRRNCQQMLAGPRRALSESVQCVGFWSAVVLPLVLFPMLVSGAAGAHLHTFAGLLVANLLALVLGRGYNRD